MHTKDCSGVIVPVITPVDSEDRVDESAFRKIIRHVIEAGVAGIFVGGSAGEGPLLTDEEWRRMVEIAHDEGGSAVNVWGGVADTSTKRMIAKMDVLISIGYEAFVATPTYYIALKSPDEHLRLFGELMEHANGMEMIAYNIPSCTNSVIPVETMCEMARRGWIRYCKESSGDTDYFKRLVSAGRDVGLKAFIGDELTMAQGLLAGACGAVGVCANYEPRTYVSAYRAAVDGNSEEVLRLNQRILLLRDALPLAGPCWIAGVKYAMSTLGFGSGKPVSPLQPLSTEQKRKTDRALGIAP